jgi:hypothetical protein
MDEIPSVFGEESYRPTRDKPLVYHLHGRLDVPASIVLTESDFYNFSINFFTTMAEGQIIPKIVRTALVTNQLLFLGYGLSDMTYRSILRAFRSRMQSPGIACMMAPGLIQSEREKQAIRYLEIYARNALNVQVYWGGVRDFVYEFRKVWEKYSSEKMDLKRNDSLSNVERTVIKNQGTINESIQNKYVDYENQFRNELFIFMQRRFSIEEIKVLSFRVGLSDGSLHEAPKDNMIKELIESCYKRSKIVNLLEVFKIERPESAEEIQGLEKMYFTGGRR